MRTMPFRKRVICATAFRILHGHKGYAFINIGGLAIGLACNRGDNLLAF
jgi:hypothetical protein